MSNGEQDPGSLAGQIDDLLERAERSEEHGPLLELLEGSRPEDIAVALGEFGSDEKIRIFEAVPVERRAEVLAETDDASRRDLIQILPTPVLAPLVQQMDPDDAADLLELVSDERRQLLLTALDPAIARDLRSLLQHDPESAGGIMTSQFIAVEANRPAREVLELLQKTLDREVVSYVYVINAEKQLQGVVSIRQIIAADPEAPIHEFMQVEVITAHVNDDQEEVAHLARRYNLNSIPVIDDQRHLLGVATIDDIVDIISEEADEDIYLLAGSPGDHPTHKPVLQRAVNRIPWLFFSVVSGITVASMQKNQGLSHESLLLVAFTPLVMGVSGGVGTQSAILMARGLATGEIELSRTLRIFIQELSIGLSIALFMGGLVTIVLMILEFGGIMTLPSQLPPAIGSGMLFGILLATTSGTLIPILCQLVRIDPALAAGPFISSLNDVVGALSYLTIGHVILTL